MLDLINLAQQAPYVIVFTLGLYAVKVLVNDIKHNTESTEQNTEALLRHAEKHTDLLERIERALTSRRDHDPL